MAGARREKARRAGQPGRAAAATYRLAGTSSSGLRCRSVAAGTPASDRPARLDQRARVGPLPAGRAAGQPQRDVVAQHEPRRQGPGASDNACVGENPQRLADDRAAGLQHFRHILDLRQPRARLQPAPPERITKVIRSTTSCAVLPCASVWKCRFVAFGASGCPGSAGMQAFDPSSFGGSRGQRQLPRQQAARASDSLSAARGRRAPRRATASP